MPTDWQVELYRLYKNELSPGLDDFLTRAAGDNWTEILVEKDRQNSQRSKTGAVSSTQSRTDIQAGLRMLSEWHPPEISNKIKRMCARETSGLASALRDDRNRAAHFATMSDAEVHNAMGLAARLLRAIHQEKQAAAFDDAATKLWNERNSRDVGSATSELIVEPAQASSPTVEKTVDPIRRDSTSEPGDLMCETEYPKFHTSASSAQVPKGSEEQLLGFDASSTDVGSTSSESLGNASPTPPASNEKGGPTGPSTPGLAPPPQGSDLYVPAAWNSSEGINRGAPREKSAEERKKGKSNRRSAGIRFPLSPTSSEGKILVGALAVVVLLALAALFLDTKSFAGDGSAAGTSAVTPGTEPFVEAPVTPRTNELDTGVEKWGSTSGIPGSQIELIVKPLIGNSAPRPLHLDRNQLRVVVKEDSFSPNAWVPPGGSTTAGTPSLVKFNSTTAWSIPMNDTGLYEQLIGRPATSWATIFYDGTDGVEWTIPPSPLTMRAWQLTYYIPDTVAADDILGFGVIDLTSGTVTSLTLFSEWPAPECPCSWWP